MMEAEKIQKKKDFLQNKTLSMKVFTNVNIAINLISIFSAMFGNFAPPMNTTCQYNIFLSMRGLF